MSVFSKIHRLFTQPTMSDDTGQDEDISSFSWNQNARIITAVVIVFFSALVLYWILSS